MNITKGELNLIINETIPDAPSKSAPRKDKLIGKDAKIAYICDVVSEGELTSWNETGFSIYTYTTSFVRKYKRGLNRYGVPYHIVDVKEEEGEAWDPESYRWRLDIEFNEVGELINLHEIHFDNTTEYVL